MIYYRRYVADFRADTMALSMMEQGAYDRLLDHYYATEQPIPLALDRAAIICRAVTAKERAAVKDVLEQYFERGPDGWHQKRADHEIAMSEKARFNGARNTGKGTGSGTGLPTGSDTGTATGEATGDRTDDRTGSGQPFSLSTKTSLSTTPPSQPFTQNPDGAAKTPPSGSPKTRANPANLETWNAYASAYEKRYGTQPVRNAKVNTHIARFVERVGADEAPQIAAFYLTHSRSIYVAANHDTGLMQRDAEGLRTEWATGRRVTQTQANQADRTQATGSAFQKLIEEAESRERLAR